MPWTTAQSRIEAILSLSSLLSSLFQIPGALAVDYSAENLVTVWPIYF